MSNVLFGGSLTSGGSRVSHLHKQHLLETWPSYRVTAKTWQITVLGPAVRDSKSTMTLHKSTEMTSISWDRHTAFWNFSFFLTQLNLAGSLLAALEDITHYGWVNSRQGTDTMPHSCAALLESWDKQGRKMQSASTMTVQRTDITMRRRRTSTAGLWDWLKECLSKIVKYCELIKFSPKNQMCSGMQLHNDTSVILRNPQGL